MALDSAFPMFVAWGPDLRFLYNDAYAALIGDKHPAALAEPFQQVWAEIWTELRADHRHGAVGQIRRSTRTCR